MRNRFAALAVALCVLAPPAPALAQGYPSKPVRLVVPSTPASVTGAVGGIIAQQLAESLGQSVMVDNRRGANGAAGARIVAKSAPDGYTLLLVTASQAINSTLAPDPNVDLAKNFAPVSLVASIPLLLAVNPAVPAKDVKELVAFAAAKPGQVSFASSNTGSASHLAAEMLKIMAKVDLVRLPYKSDSASLQDLVSGQAQLMFEDMPSLLPSVRSGKLRGLAVTSAQRSPTTPDLPTMIESGYAGFEATSWYGLLAPAGTPADIIARINSQMVTALRAPLTRKLLAERGAEPVGNSAAEFTDFFRAEVAKWSGVAKAANVKMD